MHTQRTECPHCQHQFNISDEQLALKNGLARCGKCHQIFDANEHLLLNMLLGNNKPISAPSTAPTSIENPKNSLENFVERFKEAPITENQLPKAVPSPVIKATPNTALPNNATPHNTNPQNLTEPLTKDNPPVANAILADDTPPIDPKPTPAPRSLNQKKQFNPNEDIIFDDNINDSFDESRSLADNQPTPKLSDDFSLEILADFDTLTNPNTPDTAFKDTIFKDAGSTTPAPPNEEAWLEQLLNEEKEKELNASHFDSNKISAIPANATDVDSLLDEFGVEVAPLKQLSEDEAHQKIEQRLAHQSTPQKIAKKERRSLFPTLLWSLGSGLLLLGLIAQYVAYNRDEIVKHPSEASTLRALCGGLSLPCNLANADSNAIAVQVNKLEANGNKTDATLTLTNQSHVTQLYPTLKLTLLANNTDVGQMIATPKQYLDTSNLHMIAEQIKPIKLRLDLPKAKFDKIAIEKLY